jgi:hypothetical protein
LEEINAKFGDDVVVPIDEAAAKESPDEESASVAPKLADTGSGDSQHEENTGVTA